VTCAVLPYDLIRRRAIEVELEIRRRQQQHLRDRSTPEPRAVTQHYGEWIAGVRPEYRWDAPHFRVMQHALDEVTAGRLRRLFFQIPIRHGKTEHNTIGYGAYRLQRNPTTRIIMGSFNQAAANRTSRKIRRLARACGVVLSRDRDTAAEWETEEGGGVIAVGPGSGAASLNADLIIIDDPIGSRDDAESKATRDQGFDWITNDLFARAEPHTAILMSMSRWHADDPAGRIKDRFGDRWTFVDLPGEAEKDDPLGRAIGDPLWPEMRGKDWLEEKRIELLDYGFASLIQGRPRPREGGMFKWDHWKLVSEIPKNIELVRYWDLAGTRPKGSSHDPDYTAGVLAGRNPDGRSFIADVTRFRVEVGARDAKIEEIARADLAAYPQGVVTWFERQSGIGGTEASEALLRRLQAVGMETFCEPATGSKEERARPLASAVLAQNVDLGPDTPENPWRIAFRDEAADFPNGKHDDQLDGAAGAFNKLDREARRSWSTFDFHI
jgi:predicted phage terminase large subunit-like protein